MQSEILWPESWSRNLVKKKAKPVAKEMVRRSEAYSLVKQIKAEEAGMELVFEKNIPDFFCPKGFNVEIRRERRRY